MMACHIVYNISAVVLTNLGRQTKNHYLKMIVKVTSILGLPSAPSPRNYRKILHKCNTSICIFIQSGPKVRIQRLDAILYTVYLFLAHLCDLDFFAVNSDCVCVSVLFMFSVSVSKHILLTLTPLTWRIWRVPNEASRWQMGST